MEAKDPLAELVIDEGALARDELAGALRPYVRFTARGDLLLEEEFSGLSALRRVACILLAFRAAHLLGMRGNPGATPKEIVAASGMAPGTVRPKLSELARLRLVTKNADAYEFPVHAIRRGTQLVKGGFDG